MSQPQVHLLAVEVLPVHLHLGVRLRLRLLLKVQVHRVLPAQKVLLRVLHLGAPRVLHRLVQGVHPPAHRALRRDHLHLRHSHLHRVRLVAGAHLRQVLLHPLDHLPVLRALRPGVLLPARQAVEVRVHPHRVQAGLAHHLLLDHPRLARLVAGVLLLAQAVLLLIWEHCKIIAELTQMACQPIRQI